MSTLRQDPTTKEWVIFAAERARRPHDFVKHGSFREAKSSNASCPFCPGNEALTPPDIFVLPRGGSLPWSVRVVSNKFAALAPGGIPMQFPEDYRDYLVSDVETCANKVLDLLDTAEEREAFSDAGQEKVRKEFLLPRLIRDELKLIKDVLAL